MPGFELVHAGLDGKGHWAVFCCLPRGVSRPGPAACFPAGAEAALGTPEAYQEDLEKFAGGCRIEEVREPLFPVGGTLRPFHSLAELRSCSRRRGRRSPADTRAPA